MKYLVTLSVRKRGAIGIGEFQKFEVQGEVADHTTDEGKHQLFALWQERYGEQWEPLTGIAGVYCIPA